MRQLNHLLPFGKKTVIGRIVLFPNPFKLILKSLHIIGVLHDQHVLPVVLDGLGGPVEGACDEHPPVHDGELVVHVAAVLVVAHLDPCSRQWPSTGSMTWAAAALTAPTSLPAVPAAQAGRNHTGIKNYPVSISLSLRRIVWREGRW